MLDDKGSVNLGRWRVNPPHRPNIVPLHTFYLRR